MIRSILKAALAGGAFIAVASAAPAPPDAGAAPRPSPVPRYEGLRCPDPVGHRVTQCRLGIHGTPDLSRRSWAKVAGVEVTVSAPFRELSPNPALGGTREWPVVDSLGRAMGTLRQTDKGKIRLAAIDGKDFSVIAMNVRGHGCAASDAQMTTQTLAQIIAPKAPGHGTQAFLPIEAVAKLAARAAFTGQLGGAPAADRPANAAASSGHWPIRPSAPPPTPASPAAPSTPSPNTTRSPRSATPSTR